MKLRSLFLFLLLSGLLSGAKCKEVVAEDCTDEIDNDEDGLIDCDDSDCEIVTACAGECGDNVINGTEECDGVALGGASCTGEGFDGGDIACANDCTLDTAGCTTCGDGDVQTGEGCDDGNTNNNDGCSSACTVENGFSCAGDPSVCTEICGDGLIVGGEQCDDDNVANDDGCADDCSIEVGFACAGEPSVCTTDCGDGITAGVEECDDNNNTNGDGCTAACVLEVCGDNVDNNNNAEECDGNDLAGQDCTDQGFSGGTLACANDCTFDTAGCTTCGDGNVEVGEGCDDGNTAAGDGCDAVCAIENGFNCAGDPSVCTEICGDGLIVGVEECDDNNTTDGDGCTAACIDEFCGDAIDNDGNAEQCDDGNNINDDACKNDCTLPLCGDNIVSTGEECDDNNTTDGDGCNSLCLLEFCGDGAIHNTGTEACDDGVNNSDTVADACRTDCTLPSCGDNVVDSGEGCDDGNNVDNDGCDALCVLESCGDGIVQTGEQCDDTNTVSGDGCSNLCVIELCGDGIINNNTEECDDIVGTPVNGDGCSATCTFEFICAANETLVRFSASDVPLNIPDNIAQNASSVIAVADTANVRKVFVGLGRITHAFDGDLDIFLVGPNAISRELSTDNGGGGDNYISTLFDDAGATLITAGAPPFKGRFRPEQNISGAAPAAGFGGISAAGNWTLRIVDDETPDAGVLEDWTLGLCLENPPVCGNGFIEAGEQCDDNNLTNNDGCSDVCQLESTCGDGVQEFLEVCDDGNAVSGDGCSSDCFVVENGFTCVGTAPTVCTANCGDNLLVGIEQCDDGNQTNGDGCSSACAFEIICAANETALSIKASDVPLNIPDNIAQNASSVIAVANTANVRKVFVGIGNITHAFDGDLDIFLVGPNTVSRELSTDNGAGGDNYISTLFQDDGATNFPLITAGVPPFRGIFNPEQTISGVAPADGFGGISAAGNWTLRIVDDATPDAGVLNSWTLGLCLENPPVCGNGFIEAGEQCDDNDAQAGDGCDSLCQVEPGFACAGEPSTCIPLLLCGNGVADAGEACDDANTNPGDGCSNTCTVEAGFACVGFGAGSCHPIVCGDNIIDAPETCDDGNNVSGDGCAANTCLEEAGFDCVGVGPGSCTAICGDGLTRGTEQCDDGNLNNGDGCSSVCQNEAGHFFETEPNDNGTVGAQAADFTVADVLPAGNVIVHGSIGVIGDQDFYSFTCTGTCNINAETFDGNIALNSCTNTDTVIRLFDSNGVQLTEDDEGGALGNCSGFNTASDTDVGLRLLPAGTYFIEVERFTNNAAIAAYQLRLNFVSVCGDNVVSGIEQCDGGNTANGDGCSSVCRNETCGDGIVTGIEQCDDIIGTPVSGDGCSDTCQLELTCGGGETAVIVSSTDVPRPIPDNNTALGISNVVSIPTNGAVTQVVAVVGDISHTQDDNIDIALVSAVGTSRNMVLDRGAAGDNFNSTILRDDNATNFPAISTGVVPFRGTFNPEQSVSTASPAGFGGENALGNWTLRVFDDATIGQNGALTSWTLGLCINTGVICGNGTTEAPETCDDGNLVSGDGCNAQCRLEVCGDGIINNAGLEACDDGNTTNGDCCSAACQIEAGCEVEPNNNTAQALVSPQGIASNTANLRAAINPIGDIDFFAFTLSATADLRVELFDGTGTACGGAIDPQLQLFSADGLPFFSDDDDGLNNCSLINSAAAQNDLNARAVPPGTYFIRVNDFGNDNVIAAYRAILSLNALCGDGTTAGSETCDDGNTTNGDGCSSSCRLETCGDGIVTGLETCDDGNTAAGDGCSSACQFELSCDAGQQLIQLNSGRNFEVIPDGLAAGNRDSVISVSTASVVRKIAVGIGTISHITDDQLDISLVSPTGTVVNLSDDNGAAGDDYVSTLFNEACVAAPGLGTIVGKTAPFRGCFDPEGNLDSILTQASNGNWTLRIADDSAGAISTPTLGILRGWTLNLCVDNVGGDLLPVAVDDTPSVDEDSSNNSLNVTANDTLGDGANVVAITVGPTNGTATVSGNNIIYTPNANFNGTDSITYSLTDADLDSDTAVVTITVNSVDDLPIAADDSFTVDEDSVNNSLNVTANDPSFGDGGALVALPAQPANGTAVVSGLNIIYTPNANFNGTEIFSYELSDIDGDVSVGIITVTVNASNDAPTANDVTASVDENGSVVITLSGADIDGANLTFVPGSPSNGSLGAVTQVTATSATVTYTPNTNFDGTDSFTYVANDSDANSAPATVSITVNNVPRCGDGTVDAGETCDDGNLDNTDGCTTTCIVGKVCNATTVPGADRFAVDPATGVCYASFDGDLTTFSAANDLCKVDGGYLATITSAAENTVVLSVKNTSENPWIGASEDGNDVDAIFDWVTNETFDLALALTLYAAGEPDDDAGLDGNGNCLHISNIQGQWADTNCDFAGFVTGRICEYELNVCGDSVTHSGAPFNEECDDGNNVSGDGCNSLCQLEVSGLVINEFDYDQPGVDSLEFVEIFNGTAAAVSLADLRVVAINGANGTTSANVALSAAGTDLAPGEFLVVGNAGVQALLPAGTKFISIAANSLQNDNESIGLIRVNGDGTCTTLDGVAYENEDGAVTAITQCSNAASLNFREVTALGADIPVTGDTTSFARFTDGSDSDNNSVDFTLATNSFTPGSANP